MKNLSYSISHVVMGQIVFACYTFENEETASKAWRIFQARELWPNRHGNVIMIQLEDLALKVAREYLQSEPFPMTENS